MNLSSSEGVDINDAEQAAPVRLQVANAGIANAVNANIIKIFFIVSAFLYFPIKRINDDRVIFINLKANLFILEMLKYTRKYCIINM